MTGSINNSDSEGFEIATLAYPCLFVSADELSHRGQTLQKRLFVLSMSLNLTAALFASLGKQSHYTLGIVFFCMVSGMGATIAPFLLRPDVKWFRGRALAESVKTLSWRYMTCAEPYFHGVPAQEADNDFASSIDRSLSEASIISDCLSVQDGSAVQISPSMRQLRSASLDVRRTAYLKYRIMDQKVWYGIKAKSNHKHDQMAGVIILFGQLATILIAAYYAYSGTVTSIYFVGVMTTLLGSITAWQQLYQFSALASAYGMASQDLAMVESKYRGCETEAQFSEFVLSAEQAISREHTFWNARRKIPW